MVANGTYMLDLVTSSMSEEGPLVNIYNDEGKVMGTNTEDHLIMLHSVYCHTKQVGPQIFEILQ